MNVLKKIKEDNIATILLSLVLITLPLSFAVNSISIILFFIFGGVYVFKNKKGRLQNKPIVFIFFTFYLLCILSLFWTDNLTATRNGLERFISYLIIPLTFVFLDKISLNRRFILNAFVYFLTCYAVYCLFFGLFKAFIHLDLSFVYYHKLSNNLGQINAIYLSTYISFAYAYLLVKKERTYIETYMLFFLVFFLIMLSSKIVISITLVLSLIYILKKRKNLKIIFTFNKVIFSILVFSLLLGASTNLKKRIQTELALTKFNEVLTKKEFGSTYLWTGSSLRVFQIRMFTEILFQQEKYLLGSGLHNSQKGLADKYKEYKLYDGFLNYNYHNQYIQIFAELGLLGFLLLLFMLFLPLQKAILEKNFLLFYFVVLIITVCATESFLWRQRGMVFFITMLMLLYTKKNKFIPF